MIKALIPPLVAGLRFGGKGLKGHTEKCVASGENCKTSQKASVAVLKNQRGLKIGTLVSTILRFSKLS
jgi:hypothetical protein